MSVELRAVTEDEAEIRLDRWFRRHFPNLTQGAIQKLCRTGQIRVDGKRAEAATRLAPGQAVRVPPIPTAPPPPAERPIDPQVASELQDLILYRDDHVVVLNKPHGLAVQGGPGITRHLDGMLDGLRLDSPHRPRLVHRLDRDTSGVLVLARTPGVAAKLAAAFRGRDVRKTYWAVVAGRPIPPEGRIDLPLLRYAGARGERSVPAARNDEEAQRAVTDYRTLDHAGQKLAWLELNPITGRTHQLRVHCVALGTPIVGDLKYHEPDQNGARSAIIDGLSNKLHLHARALDLPHPAGGRLQVEANLPPHMKETFKTLGFEARPARPAVRK
ncbi:MAG TPA: RluA family pseudouridine synthase [Acetobacteraceae bacterium]|nr:RluA family pseudouridine synthase [Acetobacteraceae bacterium]